MAHEKGLFSASHSASTGHSGQQAFPAPSYAPPAYTSSSTPAAGHRLPLVGSNVFPTSDAGPSVAQDADGSPVYVASVILNDQVVPCKAIPTLPGAARWCWGGEERWDGNARYDILPITKEMEWVQARDGQLPKGRRAVEGGYESDGKQLYHALVTVQHGQQALRVPGKTGEHLHGANCAFGGAEHHARDGYEVLVWR